MIELGHDYLWRYACRLPSRGQIGIFNRSHYEEVLVVQELLIVKGELEAEAPHGAAADPFTARQERDQAREPVAQAEQAQQDKKPEKTADQGT